MKDANEVQDFERLEQQLHAMLTEMGELSKKKANDGINKFKLKLINALLDHLNTILESHKPFQDFDKFDENDLPTNSDVVIMLSQYTAAMFLVRSENTAWSGQKWVWLVKGKVSDIATGSPQTFKFGAK